MKETKFKSTELGPIPVDWEVKRLGDVCEKIRNGYGYDFREQGIYPMSRIETISSGEINYQRIVKIAEEPPVEYRLKVGDILYSHINSLSYIGNVAQYEGKEILYHGMNLLLLRPIEKVDSVYLKFLLKSEPMRNMAKSVAKVAINQASISTKELAQFPLVVPPLAEQKAIAETLSDVDALIAAQEELIEKKRAIKQGAMQELLTGKKRLPGFGGKCRQESLETEDFNAEAQRRRGSESKMTEVGLIPVDWEVKRLGEIANFSTSTVFSKDIDISWYIGTENMLPDRAGVISNTIDVPYSSVREYIRGDVLISNIRPYLKKVWLADCDGGCSTDVLVLRSLSQDVCIPEFLKSLVSGDDFFDFAMANAVGTKMPRGDKKVLVNFEVKLPGVVEQRAIVAVLSDMDAEISELEAQKAKFESIKQGMMQELLTGKTRLV